MNFNLAVVAGDGIGPEVMEQNINVLNAIGEKFGHTFNYEYVLGGGCAIDKYGEPLPQHTIDVCKASDSVLLGAVGGWQWDTLPGDKRPERALLGLRGALGLYANLRPATLHDALKDACPLKPELVKDGVDVMVVRELTGGMYFGEKGRKQTDMGEAAYDVEQYSVKEVERIARTAFEIAMKRNKHVTNVDKQNVLESSRLWRKTMIELSADYPEVELTHMYVDNAAMQLAINPAQFDVIVTSNIFGDILSDLSSAIAGSIGMLPSASLGATKCGMYEPIHGSAPDIAGMDIANPIATIVSAAMMLEMSFGLVEEAKAINDAVDKVLDQNYRTTDIMSDGMKKVGCKEMAKLIAENI